MSERNGASANDSPVIGIDLGTSTSALAMLMEERAELLPDKNGDRIVPSVVQLALGNQFVVGAPAKASAVSLHDRTVLEVKRLMGTDETIRLGPRNLTPEEISAQILLHLKTSAEDIIGREVKDIVLSVPARFENEAREATRRAAEKAGLNVLRLINEPTAAALSYGLNHLDEKQRVLVFDFGGGTLDVTVLEMFEGVLDVKTSVGDDKLGGKDVDELLINLFRDTYAKQRGKKLPAPSRDRKAAQMLKEAAERYKILLSDEESVEVNLPYLSEEGGITLTLTREMLEERMENMLLRAITLTHEALARARLSWEEIDVLLPVGGSSRIPMFRRALEAQWGRPLTDHDDPDEAVAKGAAIAAGIERRAFEEAEASKKAILILDVSPHRLGVATIKQVGQGQFVDDYFSEIIPKDQKLPAHQQRIYHTAFFGAEPISIRIFEAANDSNLCRDHHLISELPLRNLSPDSEGEPVMVDFRYTLDGTLDVSVSYIAVPSVRVQGQFVVTGSLNGTGANGVEAEPVLPVVDERWREMDRADTCAPLIEQAERLEKENPESAPILRAAANALKLALLSRDESDVRRQIDALTDLLFEMV
jgi:molecular chaperone DnaK